MNTPNPNPVGSHPWANSEEESPQKALRFAWQTGSFTAGGKASTAFQCALEIAKDLGGTRFSRRRTVRKPQIHQCAKGNPSLPIP